MLGTPRLAAFMPAIANISAHRRRFRLLAKAGMSTFNRRLPLDERAILFVLGCQRSGTSLILRMIEQDWQAQVFGERHNRLTSDDRRGHIRLNRLDKVRATLEAMRFPFIVAKPLVESQHARCLLDTFPNSRIVWLYRNYRDVAASNLNRWGERNGVDTLRPIIANDFRDWRGDEVDAESRSLVEKYFDEEMNPFDAAALFWHARNRQFLRNRLDQPDVRQRVMLLPYERMVKNPLEAMTRIYDLVGRPFPGPHLVARVHGRALGKGRDVSLLPEIDAACRHLLDFLHSHSGTDDVSTYPS